MSDNAKETTGNGSGESICYAELREFIGGKKWAVYKVRGDEGKYFVDTAFGPMWQKIPDGIDAAGVTLDSLKSVLSFIRSA